MRLLLVYFISIISFASVEAQVGGDDSWLDPDPRTAGSDKPKNHHERNYPDLMLTGFGPGGFYHSEVYNYCQSVMKTLENIERKGNDIIRVTIKGFADGLRNEHVIEENELPPYCLKYSNYDKGKEDVQLATIRACYVESVLRNLLVGKSYAIYVNFNQEYYDEPDGGKEGPEHRKVMVKIAYIKDKDGR